MTDKTWPQVNPNSPPTTFPTPTLQLLKVKLATELDLVKARAVFRVMGEVVEELSRGLLDAFALLGAFGNAPVVIAQPPAANGELKQALQGHSSDDGLRLRVEREIEKRVEAGHLKLERRILTHGKGHKPLDDANFACLCAQVSSGAEVPHRFRSKDLALAFVALNHFAQDLEQSLLPSKLSAKLAKRAAAFVVEVHEHEEAPGGLSGKQAENGEGLRRKNMCRSRSIGR